MMPPGSKHGRRDALRGAFAAGGVWLAGFEILDKLALRQTTTEAFAGGKLLGVVEFSGESRVALETPLGAELDGRLYADLSKWTRERTITPTEGFFIRTRASELPGADERKELRMGGLAQKAVVLPVVELTKAAKPLGVHLLECAGNARSVHFGMMSTAEWSGVPLVEVLEGVKAKTQENRVLVSGFDEYLGKSVTSVAGASWVFSMEELRSAGAFLATEMNGQPLGKDHGAPLRLVVPGWYGCTCIKWVNEISFVKEEAEATSQMQEYAARTMQKGLPRRAREFQPAVVETAAMPIRVEKWAVSGKTKYRVLGIVWGGPRPVEALQIRFNPDEDYVAVDEVQHGSTSTWRMWTHTWAPRKPDTYLIRLRAADAGAVTRRLDAGYYMRSVEIQET